MCVRVCVYDDGEVSEHLCCNEGFAVPLLCEATIPLWRNRQCFSTAWITGIKERYWWYEKDAVE